MDNHTRHIECQLDEEFAKVRERADNLQEAAEIYRDFGNFDHLHREHDLEQIQRAKKLLEGG